MATIDVNNAQFYYELHGQGDPVVLISGYGGEGVSWTPILSQLAKKFQVLIFDNRGVGQTIDDGKVLSAKLMADDTVLLCKALGLQRPHIIGRSMGGNIALTIAAHYPEYVNKLGILVSSPKWHFSMLNAFAAQIALHENKVAFDICFKASMAWLLGNTSWSNHDFMSALKHGMQTQLYPQSITNQKRQFQVLQEFDGTQLLAQVKAATLIIYGNEDITARADESKFMASKITGAQLLEFDCAHLILYEATQHLANSLISFLE